MDGRVTLVNATGCNILGWTESELVGTNWFDMCVPERVREEVRSAYKRLAPGVESGTSVYENPILTKSGEERLIAWHGVVFRDAEGDPVGTLSSGEDVTEKRRAEEALRASETLRMQERIALEERQKLARELHDSVSQALYGIALGVNTALTLLDRDPRGRAGSPRLLDRAGPRRAERDAGPDLRAQAGIAGVGGAGRRAAKDRGSPAGPV